MASVSWREQITCSVVVPMTLQTSTEQSKQSTSVCITFIYYTCIVQQLNIFTALAFSGARYFVLGIHALTEPACALDIAAFYTRRPIPETVPANNLLEHGWPVSTKSTLDVHGTVRKVH